MKANTVFTDTAFSSNLVEDVAAEILSTTRRMTSSELSNFLRLNKDKVKKIDLIYDRITQAGAKQTGRKAGYSSNGPIVSFAVTYID